jgi:hypothetical protein
MRKKKEEIFIKKIEELIRYVKQNQKKHTCFYLKLIIDYLKVLIQWYKKV